MPAPVGQDKGRGGGGEDISQHADEESVQSVLHSVQGKRMVQERAAGDVEQVNCDETWNRLIVAQIQESWDVEKTDRGIDAASAIHEGAFYVGGHGPAERSGPGVGAAYAADDPELHGILQDAAVAIGCWGLSRFDAALLKYAGKLRLFAYAAGSVKGLVSDALFERGIRVCSAADAMRRSSPNTPSP